MHFDNAIELKAHLTEIIETFQKDHGLRIKQIYADWDRSGLDSFGEIEYRANVSLSGEM